MTMTCKTHNKPLKDGFCEDCLNAVSPVPSKPLLGCPFCGSEGLLTVALNKYHAAYVVTCSGEADPGCTGLAMNGFFDNEDDAIAAWNKRHSNTNITGAR